MKYILTVVVPIYKIKEKYLRKCIESLLNQNSDEYEIILIDDGSPDNCGAICDEYAKKHKIISVIHQKNSGVSVARNMGILHSNAEWIFFVDPDDWVEENTFKDLIELLKRENGNCDIVLFNYINEFLNGDKKESINSANGFLSKEILEEIYKSTFYKFIHNNKICSYYVEAIWNKIYNKDFLEQNNINYIKEAKKGQDRLFNADALNSTQKIYYYNQYIYHYRIYDESVTHKYNPNIVELTKIEIYELKRQLRKHNLKFTELLNARICTRLYSCMRLYYFHRNNDDRYSKKSKELRKLINSEPFCSALKNINYKLLNFKEKIFVFCLKRKFIFFLKFLIILEERRKVKK